MTLDQIYADLQELTRCGDPTFSNAANFVGSLAQQAQSGAMPAEELAELLKDVQRQINIIEDMSQLAFKEKLNTCINGLIAIAGVV